eukprot:TRINITY_DN3011_c0_g1_i5.p1 TRINITY_DN3011_c0_g1~~TRINITY_DN3011_c0_g1_i5.p1  ORF type:complete len:315 (-),score=39.22 TRINITY_DN3011_c0_g1_i5:133-1002(-)
MARLLALAALLTRGLADSGGEVLDDLLGAAPSGDAGDSGDGPGAASSAIVAPDPPGCAVDITGAMFKITRMVRNLVYSTDDCAQPNQKSSICGGDIVTAVQYAGEFSAHIASATFDCGNLNNACAQLIASAIGHLSNSVKICVMFEADCTDTLNCNVDVFDWMSKTVHAAKDIDTAIQSCEPGAGQGVPGPAPPPAKVPLSPAEADFPAPAPAPPPLSPSDAAAAPAPPPLSDAAPAPAPAPADAAPAPAPVRRLRDAAHRIRDAIPCWSSRTAPGHVDLLPINSFGLE